MTPGTSAVRRRRKVVCTIGTRPEVIKMAPVIEALRARPWADCRVLLTAQHRDLVDPMLAFFGIAADIDLDLMRPGQTVLDLTARMLTAVGEALARESPDLVLAQGDTTTVFATALACYYLRIPFGHVEAGLRTGKIDAPFPEEMNRVVASRLARIHFAPTASARAQLMSEGVDPAAVHLTGNTVIDALLATVERGEPTGLDPEIDPSSRLILVTAHRRDNFGGAIERICRAVAALHDRHPDVVFLWPVHPNPAVRPVVENCLAGHPRIRLSEPLGYGSFVAALKRSHFVLTDSGGIQEEAPALGKPVLVMRTESERPEAIEAGVARLVGTETADIVGAADELLTHPAAYRAMARGVSPYGDGQAARRIAAAVADFLAVDGDPPTSRTPESADAPRERAASAGPRPTHPGR